MAEKSDECDSCGFATTDLREFKIPSYENHGVEGERRWYCELCSGTYTSRMSRSSFGNEGQTLQIMKTLCFVGNAILAEIRKRDA